MREKALREIPKWHPEIECTYRDPSLCTGTIQVLAHLRFNAGIGRKPPDTSSCLVCSACHDAIDGRVASSVEPSDHERNLLRAMGRSQDFYWKIITGEWKR